MAIQNYSTERRPGLTTHQRLAVIPDATSPALAACIVAPKFLLNRYGRETIPGDTFNVAGQLLRFQRYVSGVAADLDLDAFEVDTASVALYGVSMEAALASFSAGFKLDSLAEPNVLRIQSGKVSGTGLNAAFYGRPVTIGDIVYCTGIESGTVFKRRVTGLRGTVGAGSFGANAAGTDSNAGNSSSNPVNTTASATEVSAPASWGISCAAPEDFDGLARGARYLTEYGEQFIITVHTPGDPGVAKVNISSVSGLFNATEVLTANSSDDFSITDLAAGGELGGVDLIITPSAIGADMTAGMVFRITIKGNYERLSTTQVVASGTYTGTRDTIYMVRVTGTNSADTDYDGATVSITDTAGVDTPSTETLTDDTNIDLGSFGLSIKFVGAGDMPAQLGLRVGDIFFVRAIAGVVSTTTFTGVVLDGPAVDTLVFTNVATALFTVAFRLPFTGEIEASAHSGGVAWTADDTNVTVEASLDTFVAARSSGNEWCPFATAVGTLVPSYRAFYAVGDDNEMQAITLASELEAIAGVVDLDNDLGFAAQEAFDGSNGETIYVLNTGGISPAAFTAALAFIENTNVPTYIGAVTEDADVRAAVKAHVNSASSSTIRNVRRAYFGIDSPGKHLALSVKADTTNYTATVSPHGAGNLLVTVISGADESLLTTRGLVAGDLAEIDGVEYPVASVVSDYELLLSSGPGTTVDPAVTLRVFKADTVASQTAYIQEAASALGDRRCILCWTERGTRTISDASTVVPARFAAAFVAGLRSYLNPAQGMTRQAVTTFSRTPRMYSRYRAQDLDAIAAAGVLIIAQESATKTVRIRHQLTSDVSNGILYWEDSVGVRVDALQLITDAVLDEILGNVNTTEEAVDLVRAKMIDTLDSKRKVALSDTAGPLINGYSDLVVNINTVLADRIEVTYNVAIGPPLNTIVQTINAFATLP